MPPWSTTLKSRVFSILGLAVLLGGCGSGTMASSTPRASSVTQNDRRTADIEHALTAMGFKISSGVHVYQTDSIAVRYGNSIANFPAASNVHSTASGLTVVDADSGQSFKFPAGASVDLSPGGGRVYVRMGDSLPTWAKKSNARLLGQQ